MRFLDSANQRMARRGPIKTRASVHVPLRLVRMAQVGGERVATTGNKTMQCRLPLPAAAYPANPATVYGSCMERFISTRGSKTAAVWECGSVGVWQCGSVASVGRSEGRTPAACQGADLNPCARATTRPASTEPLVLQSVRAAWQRLEVNMRIWPIDSSIHVRQYPVPVTPHKHLVPATCNRHGPASPNRIRNPLVSSIHQRSAGVAYLTARQSSTVRVPWRWFDRAPLSVSIGNQSESSWPE